ncbi:MAG: hypothetical protein AAB403_12710, partial [Planctomycetota bacterium]
MKHHLGDTTFLVRLNLQAASPGVFRLRVWDQDANRNVYDEPIAVGSEGRSHMFVTELTSHTVLALMDDRTHQVLARQELTLPLWQRWWMGWLTW